MEFSLILKSDDGGEILIAELSDHGPTAVNLIEQTINREIARVRERRPVAVLIEGEQWLKVTADGLTCLFPPGTTGARIREGVSFMLDQRALAELAKRDGGG